MRFLWRSKTKPCCFGGRRVSETSTKNRGTMNLKAPKKPQQKNIFLGVRKRCLRSLSQNQSFMSSLYTQIPQFSFVVSKKNNQPSTTPPGHHVFLVLTPTICNKTTGFSMFFVVFLVFQIQPNDHPNANNTPPGYAFFSPLVDVSCWVRVSLASLPVAMWTAPLGFVESVRGLVLPKLFVSFWNVLTLLIFVYFCVVFCLCCFSLNILLGVS